MRETSTTRRRFLRASGVALGLPLLPGLGPRAESASRAPSARRMFAFCAPLGIHTPNLFPEKSGMAYEATPYLEPFQPLRKKVTVLSGLMHPMVDGAHDAEKSFLTGAAHPSQPSFRNTLSVDQFAAERIGHLTRFPSLILSADGRGISYTRSGVMIPTEQRPSRVFARFFLEGSASEKAARMRRIKAGQSILDLVSGQARDLQKRTGREGHATLDQYFTSVRECEKRMVSAEEWEKKPKPKVDEKPPTDIDDRTDFTGRMGLMLDLVALALQTDSTRLVTLKGPGGDEVVNLQGVSHGWHNVSHHGKDPGKIRELSIIEREEMRLLAAFLGKLEAVREGDHTLLDNTAVLLGSNLGNASSHNNTNLPIIAAGGRLRHAGHLDFRKDPHAPPLANLLVSFLRHLEIEVDRFSSGTGAMRGLEPA